MAAPQGRGLLPYNADQRLLIWITVVDAAAIGVGQPLKFSAGADGTVTGADASGDAICGVAAISKTAGEGGMIAMWPAAGIIFVVVANAAATADMSGQFDLAEVNTVTSLGESNCVVDTTASVNDDIEIIRAVTQGIDSPVGEAGKYTRYLCTINTPVF